MACLTGCKSSKKKGIQKKNGKKKIIYQTPWVKENNIEGMVEISFNIPDEMPHFVRK